MDKTGPEQDEAARAARRDAEAELEIERQRVLRMRSDRLRSLGEMAAGMAHELNQPLVGVRGIAEHMLIGLERGWSMPEERQREKLEQIIAQAERMSHIIEHVRLFAREAASPEVRLVQVNNVVESALKLLSEQLRARGLELRVTLDPDLPPVLANPFSLEEVVINVLVNARDAVEDRLTHEPDTARPRVAVETHVRHVRGRGVAEIRVTDWGMGIPASAKAQVFDPFFTTKDPDKGTGLGLSISKTIIEQVGGSIELESSEGHGTTVILSLPVPSSTPEPAETSKDEAS
jgi:C4-dicarboxylate-specific signal transduction histidine kinase